MLGTGSRRITGDDVVGFVFQDFPILESRQCSLNIASMSPIE
ncbi:MAG: hypothetical protein R2849_12300 [Thermomicrobiales bacterium]